MDLNTRFSNTKTRTKTCHVWKHGLLRTPEDRACANIRTELRREPMNILYLAENAVDN